MAETKDSAVHPEINAAWVEAKRDSPPRKHYTDEELVALRIRYWPAHSGACLHPGDAVVIWTLLDMLEEQRGWKP